MVFCEFCGKTLIYKENDRTIRIFMTKKSLEFWHKDCFFIKQHFLEQEFLDFKKKS